MMKPAEVAIGAVNDTDVLSRFGKKKKKKRKKLNTDLEVLQEGKLPEEELDQGFQKQLTGAD